MSAEQSAPVVDNHWRLTVTSANDSRDIILSTEVTGETEIEESAVSGVLRLSYIDHSTGRQRLAFIAVRNLEAIVLEHLG